VQIIVGTSAGAINAAGIACDADRFDLAVSHLVDVWREFSPEQIYRADALGVIRSGARWLTLLTAGWAIARWRRLSPRSLLDNGPLAKLLEAMLPLARVPEVMRAGATCTCRADNMCFGTLIPFPPKSLRRGALQGSHWHSSDSTNVRFIPQVKVISARTCSQVQLRKG
jgi:hypothetical protein